MLIKILNIHKLNNFSYPVFLSHRPTLRIASVTGMQRLDNDIEIDNETDIWFAIKEPLLPIPNCFNDTDKCYKQYPLKELGMGTLMKSLT